MAEIDTHRGDHRPSARLLMLFGLIGFCAGLPFYLFSSILSLRLARNGVELTVIGFFAWVGLLPTFKFLWAPLVDRFAVPGFARAWGGRRGWIMASQLGIVAAIVGLALSHPDGSLALTALWAVLLAFWTTMLEIAADGWRIEVAGDAAMQGPIVAANIWGYRAAMVGAGSGVLLIADRAGWVAGYLAMAAVAGAAFLLIAATPPERGGGRVVALATGTLAVAAMFAAVALLLAAAGWVALSLFAATGLSSSTNVTPWVLAVAMLPFAAMALAIPAIRRMAPDAPARRSGAIGPYVDFFWRYGFATLAILAFVALYRMGDVLALTLSKPFVNTLGYSLRVIGVADGVVALAASIAGVGLGGWLASRWSAGRTLALGALLAGLGNFAFAWLGTQPQDRFALYAAVAADQFGNGFAGTVFVVYLSLLVNPGFASAQYALLSGFAFLLPRLIGGSAGAIAADIGYPAFFLLSGALSLSAIILLPVVLRAQPREVAA